MAFRLESEITVHRIARLRHPFLDGRGASLHGGRWNSIGHPVVYTSSSLALATLEYLVNANTLETPAGYGRIEVRIPPGVLVERAADWGAPDPLSDDRGLTQPVGDRWLESGAALLLEVPSAVVDGIESNFLIDPRHPDFRQIGATAPVPVRWDRRLFRA